MAKKQGKYESKEKTAARRRLRLPGWLFILAVVVYDELLLHLWTADAVTFPRLGVVLLFALGCGTVLALVTSLLKPRPGKYLAVGMALVLAVLYMMEYFIDDSFQVFMSLTVVAAGAGGVATDFAGTVVNLLRANLWRIALVLAPIAVYALGFRASRRRKSAAPALALAAAAVYALTMLVVWAIPGYADGLTTAFAFDNAVSDYGLNVALVMDVVKGGEGASFTETPEPTEPPTQEPTEEATEDSTAGTEAPTEPPVVYEPQVLDIDFAALAAASGSNLASIHQYVASLTPSMTNEYTGLFAGKNLILITAEAFTGAVIDPELTPTLYRLANEGIRFTDYYQPMWGAGTTGGEYSNVVGLVPGSGSCMKEATQQDLFLTIGNQLQDLGYTSAAFHNNSYTYYDRHKTHTLLGYDKFIGMGNGMEEGVKGVWPQSDQEMFDFTITDYLDAQPFSLYYMTVSGHSAYSTGGNAMSRKNYDAVAHLDRSEAIKCYIAANLELEYAMASLVSQLEAAGIADDTVIVISSDHYPYGLDESDTWGTSASYLSELFGEKCDSRFVRDRNTLIIWSGSIEDQDIVVDAPTYSLDILPTLSNLFGVEYDSRLLVGRDVFSDTAPLVFWPDYSWKTDKGTYDSSSRTFTPNEGVTVDEDYAKRISAQVGNRLTYSKAVQTYDYFNDVVKALAE